MKCQTHNAEAIGICAYCGRAVCVDCSKASPNQRLVCSANCSVALAHDDKAIQFILQKSLQSARASAFYSFLCGVLSAGGSIGAWFYLPVPFLVWFCAGCSIVFLASGIWYSRISRKQNP